MSEIKDVYKLNKRKLIHENLENNIESRTDDIALIRNMVKSNNIDPNEVTLEMMYCGGDEFLERMGLYKLSYFSRTRRAELSDNPYFKPPAEYNQRCIDKDKYRENVPLFMTYGFKRENNSLTEEQILKMIQWTTK